MLGVVFWRDPWKKNRRKKGTWVQKIKERHTKHTLTHKFTREAKKFVPKEDRKEGEKIYFL